VAGIDTSSPEGRIVWAPEHPLADERGLVRLPDVDLGEQMTHLVMAQRGFQASVSNLYRVKACYDAAIQMGRS
jgi:flagellar basal-body rod protein FlgC